MDVPVETNPIDPYAVLDLSYKATEEEIQEAFQTKMASVDKLSNEAQVLIQAYGMIRHPSGREAFRMEDVRFFEVGPFEDQQKKSLDFVALAKELAFLSPWELGDDSCLN